MDVLVILVLLLVTGLLAMSEIAVVSSQRARLKQRADHGSAGAAAALALSDSPTRFLSTVQVGMTLAGILSGAVGEAALSHHLEPAIARVRAFEPYAHLISVVVVVLAITFATVLLAELVPKRLAMVNPEAIACAVGLPMTWLSRVAGPVVGLLSWITDLLLRTVLRNVPEAEPITSEEINIMIQEGTLAGEFNPEEQRLIERVLHLGDQRVDALMTHRTEMQWIDAATPIEKARRIARESQQSHFAVCRGKVDEIVGMVSVRDMLPGEGAGATPAAVVAAGTVRSLARKPVFVPESAPALRVLDRCRQMKTPMVFVVDEYGAVQGQITVEGILDRLVDKLWHGGAGPAAEGQAAAGG